MRCLVLAVILSALLEFSLADNLFEGLFMNDPLNGVSSLTEDLFGDADIFQDAVASSQDLTEQNFLAFDDPAIFPSDTYTDPLLLASTCDDHANNDREFPSGKLRARDSPPMCFTKDPTEDSMIQEWFKKLPKIFRGNNPEPESPETQRFGTDRSGNTDKCTSRYRFNLCCEGDLDGSPGPFYDEYSLPGVYVKVENCYESTLYTLSEFIVQFICPRA